jgi:hypothetical protein
MNLGPGNRGPLPPEPPEEVELAALGERIAELAALLSATEYQLLVLIREFDERYGWRGGFRSCAHWLNWRIGLAMGAAREKVRVARALGELPRIAAAMEKGELSYSKVRALTRVATGETEERLLAFAQAGTAEHLERVVRVWRHADGGDDPQAEAQRHADRHLHLTTAADGSVLVRGRLDPEVGAVLARALEAAEAVLFEEGRREERCREEGREGGEATAGGSVGAGSRRPGAAQRRADAIGRVAEAALAGGLDQGTRGDRYQVVVHVEASGAGTKPAGEEALESPREEPVESEAAPIGRAPIGRATNGRATISGAAGTPEHVPAGTFRRIACDASRVTMIHDADPSQGGQILDVGRRTRAISPALRRALEHRDEGCRFPGCDLRFCDAHHVEHWADGGETKLDNLVLLCRLHHRAVHEEGYSVELAGDGSVSFRDPFGREVPDAPPLPALAEPPVSPAAARSLLTALLAEADVEVDPGASLPEWDGRPFDLGWAVDVLMN